MIVSVADLIDRRVPLEWFESVAIVAGLCSTLAETHTAGMPALRDIVLTPDGVIGIHGRGDQSDAAALPRVLHQLLAVVPPPTSLRLFVLHAITSEGDKSPAAFEKELTYYERPGRADLIRAVRQKYFETPLPLPGSAAPVPFELPPPVEAKQEPPAAQPRRRRRWLVAAGLGAAACALVLVGASNDGNRSSSGVVRTARVLLAKTAETGRSVAGTLVAHLTPGGGDRETVVQVADATPPPASPVKRRRAKVRTESTAPIASATTDGAFTIDDSEVTEAPDVQAPEEEPTVLASDTTDAVGLDASTFAPEQESTGIVPPRLLEPVRLPSWADPASTDPLHSIELEISPQGTVERVRLLSPTVYLTDMMILSAAKTWLFEPASLDGQPVPYRVTFNLSPNR